MPENSNYHRVIFNRANTKLLRMHFMSLKDKLVLNNNNGAIKQVDSTKVDVVPVQSVQNLENVPIQKPEMPKNIYNRVRYGGSAFNFSGIGPKITKRGGNL